jgi:hypothetical protein
MAVRYGGHARLDHLGVTVDRARTVAGVVQAGSKQVGNPEPPLDPWQQQNAAVRRQPSTVEPGVQVLACYG